MTSSIAGGCLPIALGVALAIKMKGEDRKVWCFVGCMAAEMGIAHECIKYARNHNLPLCMVVEDNNLSVQTHTRETWGIKEETIREGEMKEVEKWEQGKVLRYRYKLQWPHSGIGVYIPF